ncbi:MAG: ABC-F family ATP-binding cassette domain-containing protein [Candidatus Paceibacterota bacterium]
MPKESTVLRFDEVSFDFGHNNPILDEVSFNVRSGSKITLMGQNGAGKSTLFHLITGEFKPEDGEVLMSKGTTVALARQVMKKEELSLTVREFFEGCFEEKIYNIDVWIKKALEAVNFSTDYDKKLTDLSGGQQARLLLASALIRDPDILLLDEPTNNLDKEGIAHLTKFIKEYKKTCLVISHDAEFLNSFTDGILYLDVHTRKVEQYVGNYYKLLNEIEARKEKENRKNAQSAKIAQANKDKANFFANKGGRLRLVAKRMKEKAEELEENMVDVRKEDKTIRHFNIPAQDHSVTPVMEIRSFNIMDLKKQKEVERKKELSLKKNEHLLIVGPNGIGKSHLLNSIADGSAKGISIDSSIKLGYYRQDFSDLDPDKTVFEVLWSAMENPREEFIRSTAAGFLLTADVMRNKVGDLSEGQKGLVAFTRLVLLKPGLLILDEPTNHINFRHLPVIAKALDSYKGAMVLVSHAPEFIKQIRIDEVLDLEK